MRAKQGSSIGSSRRGNPAALAATVLLLASACTAATPSASVGSSASPAPSPYVDPNPSPPFSPVVDPDPSPESSPLIDPNASPPPSGSKTSWEPAGMMVSGWLDFQAVALADGRVLVVGTAADAEGQEPLSVVLWDPATKTWADSTPLERPRSSSALVALKDGRALVIGGLNGGRRDWGDDRESYSSAYTFDPASDTWTKVGLMGMARTGPSAVVLPDGRVLVAGGYFHTGAKEGRADQPGITLAAFRPGGGGTAPERPPLDDIDVPPYGYALATAELFDPTTGTWSATGPMKYARVGAAAVTLADGRILLVGSSDWYSVTAVHPDSYVTAEVYDPATGRFTLAGRLPAIDHAAVAKLGVELPDDEGAPGAIGTLVALPDGGALLVENDRWWKHQADIRRTFRYDARTNAWTLVGQPCASAWDEAHQRNSETPGRCHGGALMVGLPAGEVLAIEVPRYADDGSQPDPTGKASLLDGETGVWADVERTPVGRSGGAAVVLRDGSVLVMGGIGADGEYALLAMRFAP